MGNSNLATAQAGSDGEYREQVLTVEPRSIERGHETEQHGNIRSLFTLWLSANMGLPIQLVGALAVILGLGFADSVAAIAVGNLIGCGLLALTASMGSESAGLDKQRLH